MSLSPYDLGYEDGLNMRPSNPYPEGSEENEQYEIGYISGETQGFILAGV